MQRFCTSEGKGVYNDKIYIFFYIIYLFSLCSDSMAENLGNLLDSAVKTAVYRLAHAKRYTIHFTFGSYFFRRKKIEIVCLGPITRHDRVKAGLNSDLLLRSY